MNWESPGFGPEYVRQEIKHAEAAGATGWLLWNPGQDYSYAFQVMPKKPKADEPSPGAAPPATTGPTSARTPLHRHRHAARRPG